MKIIKNPSTVVEKFVILMRILGRNFGVNKLLNREKGLREDLFLERTIILRMYQFYITTSVH